MARLPALAVVPLALLAACVASAQGPPAPLSIRIALLSQWTLDQHRGRAEELRQAVDGGVVDRPVFRWNRGRIQRGSLVWKPIVVLPAADAAALGGRGSFQLAGVLPPSDQAAWTTVQIAPQTAQAEDVAVLQVGGELNTIRQVLETLLVAPPGGEFQALRLAPVALVPGAGVPVVSLPFGRPVTPAPGADPFRGAPGAAFLVVRSLVRTVPNAALTVNGLADRTADDTLGNWREGDRVFVRVPLETLRGGAPRIVLGWKDRVDKPDGGDRDTLLRSSWLDGVSGR
jgi:hypothetical protein